MVSRVDWNADPLASTLARIKGELINFSIASAAFHAQAAEAKMKQNAPWNDQTGNARQGLAARSGPQGQGAYIVLYHQVPYGVYLETRYSGRYQIITPTMLGEGVELMKTLTKFWQVLTAGTASAL